MSDATIEAINSALQNVVGDDDIDVSADTKAADVEGWDSLANVRLFIELEGKFGIRFNASEIENLKNIGEISNLILSKTSG